MLKKKNFLLILIISLFFIIIFFTILNKDRIYQVFFRYFFKLPDPVKSLYMISSGKRSFSNLFNDYNVKFLPETQLIKIDFRRKKLNIKQKNSRNSFYLENFKNEIFIITKKGSFYKSNIDNFNNKNNKLNYSLIKTNFNFSNILDTLIIKNKIFVSTTYNNNGCKNLEIHFADIDKDLNFSIFKRFLECGKTSLSSGRMQKYSFNEEEGILISTSDFPQDGPDNRPQEDSSIFGKILFINLKTRQHIIFSKGHRDLQGLYVKDDLVISTEHGPRGGDEINIISFKGNYGWPIASYGDPYNSKKNKRKYLKNHIENGFVEPIHVFVPSIGISEIIILPNNFEEKWKNNALVTSLNDRSIYRIKFQSGKFNKILYTEKIFIGERIRDIKYIEKINAIIIALERTGDIGVLKKIN